MNNNPLNFGVTKIYIGDKELETMSSIDFADDNDESSISLYDGKIYSFTSTIKMSKKNKSRQSIFSRT